MVAAGDKVLVVLHGATGVGKTEVGIWLAQRLGCEIVSADSRQVFRELRIGAASPTEEELSRVRHHLVGHLHLTQPYSCGAYEREAIACLEHLFREASVAILAGGSMLYVDAVCQGIDDFPAPDPSLRRRLTEQLEREGVEVLAAQLALLDGATYATIDRRNGARVLRALEVSLQTGRPYSEWRTGVGKTRFFRTVKVGLRRPWDELSARIDRRVEGMMRMGLLDEVKALAPYRGCVALKSVGYSEIFDYLDGTMPLDGAVAKIKVNTLRYAKRQMRWWQRDGGIRWFHPDERRGMLSYIEEARGLR